MNFEPIESLTPKPATHTDRYRVQLSGMAVGDVVAADCGSRYEIELTRRRWLVVATTLGMGITTRKVGTRLEVQRTR